MKMMMMMAIMFASSVVVPLSWAQQEGPSCWTPITDCVSHVYMEHKKSFKEFEYFLRHDCCTVMNKESKDDIVCFCSVTPSIQRNDSILESFNAFLNLCVGESSFTTYCQGVAAPPSTTPIGLPSPPSSSPSDNSFIMFIYNILFQWQNQLPKRRGPELEVLIPTIVVPSLAVIIAAIRVIIEFRNNRNDKNKKEVSKAGPENQKNGLLEKTTEGEAQAQSMLKSNPKPNDI